MSKNKSKIKLAALVVEQVDRFGARRELFRGTPKQIKNIVAYRNDARLFVVNGNGSEGGYWQIRAEISGGGVG